MGTSDLLLGEIRVIEKYIEDDKNTIVFDVGAYVGEWSNEVLKKHPNVTIHQFEPSPESFKNLCVNRPNIIRKGQIVSNNIAVSSSDVQVNFFYYPNCAVLSTLFRRNSRVESTFGLNPIIKRVSSITISNYCKANKIDGIDFLKIDTEGGEFDVIKGAGEMIKYRSIEFVQFEYGGCYLDSNTTLKDVFDYFVAYGYGVYKIESDRVVRITKFFPEFENYEYSNYIASCRENL